VHTTFAPKCAYVKSNLIHRETASISIVNENMMGATSGNCSKPLNHLNRFPCNEFVYTLACNTKYVELVKRIASFETWSNENSPTVEDLAQAGFFYIGTKMILTWFIAIDHYRIGDQTRAKKRDFRSAYFMRTSNFCLK
jgi:hypothetical protein